MGPGGFFVRVMHEGGVRSGYFHLNSFCVDAGQTVRAGEVIGTVGRTGVKVSGSHLHFEVHKDGELKDPARFLSAWVLPPTRPSPSSARWRRRNSASPAPPASAARRASPPGTASARRRYRRSARLRFSARQVENIAHDQLARTRSQSARCFVAFPRLARRLRWRRWWRRRRGSLPRGHRNGDAGHPDHRDAERGRAGQSVPGRTGGHRRRRRAPDRRPAGSPRRSW